LLSAEARSRCLFFFNARTTAKDKSVFAWQRPLAVYGDYAYEPRIELYTMGMLRSDQKALNLRHLGGDVDPEWIAVLPHDPYRNPERFLTKEELAKCLKAVGLDALPENWPALRQFVRKPPFKEALAPHLERSKRVNADFQAKSTIANHESPIPVFSDVAAFHHFVVTVRGAHIVVKVDGKTIIDHVDTTREQAPLAGGYFGLRNFVPTEAQYDNLRVYRLAR
jgi:hypothetical protein